MYDDEGKVKDIYFYRQMSADELHTKVASTFATIRVADTIDPLHSNIVHCMSAYREFCNWATSIFQVHPDLTMAFCTGRIST